MSSTYAGANMILNDMLAHGALYLSLHTTAPTRDTPGVEVIGGGYVRQGISFSAPANGFISSTATVQYPAATDYWGTIEAFGIYNAVSGGTLLWFDYLTDVNNIPVTKTVTSGDIFQVPAGKIVLAVD